MAGAKNVWMEEPEPEILVPVPQTYFVGKASCTNITMIFRFQWTKSFWNWSQKLVNARVGAKNCRCLDLEPETEM